MSTLSGEKKKGLALSGGAVLGAAHVGALRAFSEKEIAFEYVSGTSIGALAAAFYAFGKSWKELYDAASGLDWLDISEFSISQYGLLSNKKIGSFMREHLGDVEFSEADMPLAVVASDMKTGKKVIFKEGNVALAVTASTCIPGIFVPVEWQDKMLVDGGVIENVPVSPLKEMGADYIVAMDLNTNRAYKKPGNIIDMAINALEITVRNATQLQLRDADLLIQPELSAYNYTDTGQFDDLVEEGYKATLEALKKVDE